MIKNIIPGDITSPKNKSDIIIGMNSELGELSALGRSVLKRNLPRRELLDLGTVLTFKFDDKRLIHMVICHHLGEGGWRFADQYIRVGLDHLWLNPPARRKFSIVQIGKGAVGTRDGANSSSIHTAIASSYLPVDLYVYDDNKATVPKQNVVQLPALQMVQGWNPKTGVLAVA